MGERERESGTVVCMRKGRLTRCTRSMMESDGVQVVRCPVLQGINVSLMRWNSCLYSASLRCKPNREQDIHGYTCYALRFIVYLSSDARHAKSDAWLGDTESVEAGVAEYEGARQRGEHNSRKWSTAA